MWPLCVARHFGADCMEIDLKQYFNFDLSAFCHGPWPFLQRCGATFFCFSWTEAWTASSSDILTIYSLCLYVLAPHFHLSNEKKNLSHSKWRAIFVNANAQSLCGTVFFMHNIIVVMLSIIFASSNKSDKIVTRQCYKAPPAREWKRTRTRTRRRRRRREWGR